MIAKKDLNKKAVQLRESGMTYSEIMERVPVAKSTLALWFKEVNLSIPQKQKITEKRLKAGLRGAMKKKTDRILRMENIISKSQKEVGKITEREMWLIGTILYWAEGSKEKEWNPGTGVSFINMDKNMIKVFLKWLYFCGVKRNEIRFDLYIHKNNKYRIEEIKKYWSKVCNFPVSSFQKIYFKESKMKTRRKNISDDQYFGILKITVKQSSILLRRITGWISGVYNGINILNTK